METPLAVQWLRLSSNAWGAGSIPGQGAEIPHTLQSKNQNRKQNKYCNKFNTLKMVHIKKKNLKKNKSSLCMSFQLSNDPEEKGKKRRF